MPRRDSDQRIDERRVENEPRADHCSEAVVDREAKSIADDAGVEQCHALNHEQGAQGEGSLVYR